MYQWRYQDEAGVVTDGPAVTFESQEGAENWLAENYPGLLALDITAVSLFDDHQAVYGPMPLTAERIRVTTGTFRRAGLLTVVHI